MPTARKCSGKWQACQLPWSLHIIMLQPRCRVVNPRQASLQLVHSEYEQLLTPCLCEVTLASKLLEVS